MVSAAGDFVYAKFSASFLHELKQRSRSSDVTGRH